MNKKIYLFFIIILLPLLLFSGFSSWILVGNIRVTIGIPTTSAVVCYNSKTNKEYRTIEKALGEAKDGETVYVYPDLKKEVIISQDCTIKAGVKLCLPYENTTHDSETFGSVQAFADNNLANRKTLVIIEENVKITIEESGSLLIGGIFGREGQDVISLTNGSYCEIQMKTNSLIDCSGNIDCFGFIKEYATDISQLNNGSMLIMRKGTINVPFTVYDFKGGTVTTEMNDAGICPFDVYDIPNVQTLFRIYSIAKVVGELRMDLSVVGHQFINVTIVGNTTSNTALILKSGYVDLKYTPNQIGGTSLLVDGSKTEANLYGELDVGSIQFSKGIGSLGISIDTALYFFPVSYKFNFHIESGSTLNVSKKAKFMPGSELYIREGATLNVNQSLIFYPENYAETPITGSYPVNLPRSIFVNDGNTIVSATGAIGGYIENTCDDAILQVSASNSVSSLDYWNPTSNVTMLSKGHISSDSDYDTLTNGKYIAKDCMWIKQEKTITKVEIVKGEETKDTSYGYLPLSVKIYPEEASNDLKFEWKIEGDSKVTPKTAEGGSVTLKNSDTSSKTVSVSLSVTIDGVLSDIIKDSGQFTVQGRERSCIASGTLITMADGTMKKVEDIKAGDNVLSFNHETGEQEVKPVMFNAHDEMVWDYMDVINLVFNDGTKLKVINEHALFDTNINQYIYINEDTYKDYIGHSFYAGDYNGNYFDRNDKVLVDTYISNEYTGVYSPITHYNLNHYADGLLSAAGGDIKPILNIFKYDDDLKYNEDDMRYNIEKYGLYTYDDFKDYYSYNIYSSLQLQYMKIVVGRGEITFEEIIDIVNRNVIENMPKDYEKS